MNTSPLVVYRESIPEAIVKDPAQAIVDGFTILHSIGGLPLVSRVLASVTAVIGSDERMQQQ